MLEFPSLSACIHALFPFRLAGMYSLVLGENASDYAQLVQMSGGMMGGSRGPVVDMSKLFREIDNLEMVLYEDVLKEVESNLAMKAEL